MRQRWWIAIVAVVGIGLAIVLFPRPDTGDAIPDDAGAEARTASGGEGATATPTPRKRPEIDPSRVRSGPHPGAEAFQARRNQPEAVYAGKLVTPFSSIRYTLVKEQTEPAKALADEIGVLMDDLRQMRLDPDPTAWPAMQEKTDAMIAKIKASEWADDEQVQRSFQKYDDFLAEYQTARAAAEAVAPGGVPGAPGTPAAGTPPGTPAETNPTPAPSAGQEGE